MSSEVASVTAPSESLDESIRYFGRVKWFNSKAGYGFCTVVGEDGSDRLGEDVFVHHSGVNVSSEQYKYLVQGEYVQFNLRASDSDSHPFQASDLTGLWGGKLMCETRNELKQLRGEKSSKSGDNKLRGGGPRDDGDF